MRVFEHFIRECMVAGVLLVANFWMGAEPVSAQSCEGPSVCNSDASSTICGRYPMPDGKTQDKDVEAFMGIRFATADRWEAPVLEALPKGQTMAQQWGNICPQSKKPKRDGIFKPNTEVVGSEDCLNLNVWRIKNAKNAPVMVFIYGGGFIFGSTADGAIVFTETGIGPAKKFHFSTDPDKVTYNGYGLMKAALDQSIEQGLVLVTANYRLGALGFLYHNADGEPQTFGNFGIMDQQAALKWVQENIAMFGGDPERVTIFGESAGAMSVGLHAFNSVHGKDYFHSAIMESNPLNIPYRGPFTVEDKKGNKISIQDQVNLESCQMIRRVMNPVATNRCLGYKDGKRQGKYNYSKYFEIVKDATKTDFKDIVKNQISATATVNGLLTNPQGAKWYSILPWTPYVGDENGTLFNSQPATTGFGNGATPVPILVGTNRDEGILFVEGLKTVLQPAIYGGALNALIKLDPALGGRTASQFLQSIDGWGADTGTEMHPYSGSEACGPAIIGTDAPGPVGTISHSTAAMGNVATDLVFRCGTASLAKKVLEDEQNAGLSMYIFAGAPQEGAFAIEGDKVKACMNADPKGDDKYQAVCHAYELPYVFSSMSATPVDGKPIQEMTKNWLQFANDPVGYTGQNPRSLCVPGQAPSNNGIIHFASNKSLSPWYDFTKRTIEQSANCPIWDNIALPKWKVHED